VFEGATDNTPHDHAYSESFDGGPEDPTPMPHTWARTVRTNRWRATFYPDPDHGELFDMHEDPYETVNLFYDIAHRDVVTEHRKILLSRLILMDYPVRGRSHAV